MDTQASGRALAHLRNSTRVVVVTGAGCSTGSGIGDYRDAQGAWKRTNPVQHQDFMTQPGWRARYWARSQRGFPEFSKARPNAAHFALAELETKGYVRGVITQNVDGLHQLAGQQRVIDLHGRLHQVICMVCSDVSARTTWQSWLETHNPFLAEESFQAAPDGDADLERQDFAQVQVPVCQRCGGLLKPHVVFYGDNVPATRVEQARQWVADADLMLVVGSSLMVYSSFRFVRQAHELGLPIVAINQGVTRADDLITEKVVAECGAWLAAAMSGLPTRASPSVR